jgi:hypothetical protein
MSRKYYSIRNGKNTGKFDLDTLKEALGSIISDFEHRGYFNEYFGWDCIDTGFNMGKVGNVSNYFLRKLRKKNLWPVSEYIAYYSEDDLFDVLELLFDNISKPVEDGAYYHSYGDCGWHYSKYAKGLGWYEFQQEINQLLEDYKDGYQITRKGEIVQITAPELDELLNEEIPVYKNTDIDTIIKHAVSKFRFRSSSLIDKKEAVRLLADCFESIREEVKRTLHSNDERDIFNIANNFGIRHKNDKQKTQYDTQIWLAWMFYYYLATLYTSIKLLDRKDKD